MEKIIKFKQLKFNKIITIAIIQNQKHQKHNFNKNYKFKGDIVWFLIKTKFLLIILKIKMNPVLDML